MQNPMPNGQHMQPPVQQAPQCPQPAGQLHGPEVPQHHHKPKPKRRFFRRFMTGYLMITGALVNIYVLSQLLILLLEWLNDHISLV